MAREKFTHARRPYNNPTLILKRIVHSYKAKICSFYYYANDLKKKKKKNRNHYLNSLFAEANYFPERDLKNLHIKFHQLVTQSLPLASFLLYAVSLQNVDVHDSHRLPVLNKVLKIFIILLSLPIPEGRDEG